MQVGDLLVAHPELTDSLFSKSVILITEVIPTGTIGYIINKKTATSLDVALDKNEIMWPFSDFLYEGGPVSRQSLVMLHSSEWYSSNTMPVNKQVSISSDKFMFEKIMLGNIPQERRFMFGQTSWNTAQLEKEIQTNKTWLTTPSDYNILFEHDGDKQWHIAIDLCARNAVEQFF